MNTTAKTMSTLITRISSVVAGLVLCVVSLSAQSAIGTVVTLTGYVLDQQTLMPVEANYGVFDAQGKKIGQTRLASIADGYLVTGLQPGASYTIRVEDPRYFKQEFSVSVPPSGTYAEVSKDLPVRRMEAGRTIQLSPAPFDLKKTDLKPGTEADMQQIAKTLIMNPSVRVELLCYPDEELPAKRAEEVSLQRATALKAFLQKEGVSAERVTITAASTTDPLNPPPLRKGAKGKRYIGPVYMKITGV